MNETTRMSFNGKKPIVNVVLGSGRSGTSLAMQLLNAVGMPVSDKMIGASEQNTEGAWEDEYVLKRHRQLFRELSTKPWLLLPQGWKNMPPAIKAKKEFKKLVALRLERHGTNWSVKDPNMASFMPMWTEIFAEMEIEPRYIVCIRDPKSVVHSSKENYSEIEGSPELLWQLRNATACVSIDRPFFLYHYEKAVAKDEEFLTELARFLDLQGFNRLTEADALAKMQATIKPSLNRSQAVDEELVNPMTGEFFDVLVRSAGIVKNRTAIQEAANAVLATAKAYECWAITARKMIIRSDSLR